MTSSTGTSEVTSDRVLYAEDRCGFGWLGALTAWAAPVVFIALLTVGMAAESFWLGVAALVPLFLWVSPVGRGRYGSLGWQLSFWQYCRVGLRVSAQGVRFGAIERTPPAVGEGGYRPGQQGKLEFFAPWAAVRSGSVVTDQAQVRELARGEWRTQGLFGPPAQVRSSRIVVGQMVPVYAKAMLVLEVYPGAAQAPTFRTTYAKKTGQPVETPQETSTWAVATRRPDRLRQALAGINRPGVGAVEEG